MRRSDDPRHNLDRGNPAEKETAGTIWREERDSGLEIEVEQGI